MKKVLALFICAIFVLSVSSYAFWGFGKKSGDTKTATTEMKVKGKKMVTKKVMVKKVKKAKTKGATPAVPVKK
jgi:hypothetical protein